MIGLLNVHPIEFGSNEQGKLLRKVSKGTYYVNQLRPKNDAIFFINHALLS